MSVNIKVIFILSLIFLVNGEEQKIEIEGKVVEIQPVALDVVVPLYDNVVVFFHKGSTSKTAVSMFQAATSEMKLPQNIRNKTLFAICDLEKDQANHLKKYDAFNEGIKFITQINQYDLSMPQKISFEEYFFNMLPVFFEKLTQPKVKTTTRAELAEHPNRYIATVTVFSERQLKQTQILYQNAYHFLQMFGVQLYAIPHLKSNSEELKKPIFELYFNEQLRQKYPASAMEALYNFTQDKLPQHQLADLIDFINTATIDEVSKLSQQNYYRVFGSDIGSQLLLIYQQSDQNDPEVEEVRKIFAQSAHYNKVDQMKFQRVLFAQGSVEFLEEYFADTLLEKTNKFVILLTKTEYSNFQLRKFEFKQKLTDPKQLIQFLQDVRMRRIDANYKSEPVPDNQEGELIRKIVGHTFLDQIFQKQDKSTLVLFIDSKDPDSYKQHLTGLQQFTSKYSQAYKDKMNVGIFDLGKNEHQLLTIRNAPELVLFERTNKKQARFFKGQPTMEIIKNFINYEVKDLTIPDNFGQQILPLGGGSDL